MLPTTVTAIAHKDVYGKTLYYLQIIADNGEIMINVGQKTHDKVIHITKQKTIDQIIAQNQLDNKTNDNQSIQNHEKSTTPGDGKPKK